MRNRFSKWSRQSSKMAYLLASCGLLYACQDPFTLDDEKPSWLNTSIYQSLQDGVEHTLDDGTKKTLTFKTYLRLLEDPDVNPENVRPLSDVLGRTGSKTVFVADDEAWETFFRNNAKLPEINPWHNATSYENLSLAQKKLLIHTSMLNNAIVMENLASSEATGNSRPIRGEYMRRYTDVELTDTIAFDKPEDLPYSYSQNDKDYWARFRGDANPEDPSQASEGGLYLAKDGTLPMMLHFTSEHMAKNSVTDDDFAKFMGRERITSDVHIYDALLMDKDVVCENGYVNVTEKPLVPLSNMAEVIRINGKTSIFSHMIDRYSAPFYSSALTLTYKNIMKQRGIEWTDQDSIFVKRYFSDNSVGRQALAFEPGPEGTLLPYQPYIKPSSADVIPSLKFDPGWNEYRDESGVERDMAAMFVPSDSALWEYYTSGGGRQLIETYANAESLPGLISMHTKGAPFTKEMLNALYAQIDQIPLGTLQSLINIIMQRSFTGSVASKMTKLRDDAQEQLFYVEDIDKIDTCLLACNGAVYVMKDIYGPADYTSVTSPAYISTTNRVMKWAIYNGSNSTETDRMGLNYYAYLKAMQSEFTFFLPSDAALQFYYDPISFKSTQPRRVAFNYTNASMPINSTCYTYNPKTGEFGRAYSSAAARLDNSEVVNRLKDMLESHTIVHDGTNPIHGEDEYFLAKNGTAVKLERDENGTVTKVWGGFQIENTRQNVPNDTTGIKVCNVVKPFEALKNGQTYVLDAPMVPTYRSVYSIIADTEQEYGGDNPYSKFYELCQVDEQLIYKCGLVDINLIPNKTQQEAAIKKYRIFTQDNGLDQNVQFFNNYRYTLFVPTNDAIDAAIANGLPTWDDIIDDYTEHCTTEMIWDDQVQDSVEVLTDILATAEDSLRIQTKILYLTNFIRYHFLDNSVFADKSALPEEEWVTSSYDKELGLFCKVHVERVKRGGETILRVCDDTRNESGNLNHKWLETVGEKNLLARDISCNTNPVGRPMAVSGNFITLDASSAAVIHSIPGVLNHTEPGKDGRYDNTWATPSKCRKYLERYAIKE